MEYDIKITEVLQKTVTVEAENKDAAMGLVKSRYEGCEYILGADDFQGVAFSHAIHHK